MLIFSLFLAFTLHRLLSGVRNGMMYNPKDGARQAPLVMALSMCLITALTALIIRKNLFWDTQWLQILMIGAAAASALASITALAYLRRRGRLITDLHLWTLLEQTALAAMLCCAGWSGMGAAVLAVYPSVFLQKAMINRFTEQSVWYNGTDDPTGRYYTIPSLGIKVPRLTQRIRFWLTVASILLLAGLIFIIRR